MSCELCGKKLPQGTCVFSAYERTIKGKEHLFCCVRCAKEFEKRKRKR
jgi:YHS domain-containing protein